MRRAFVAMAACTALGWVAPMQASATAVLHGGGLKAAADATSAIAPAQFGRALCAAYGTCQRYAPKRRPKSKPRRR